MDATKPGQAQPIDMSLPAKRRRPFGVLVVALIQVLAVAFAVISGLTAWEMPWEGAFVTLIQEHAWARVLILGLGLAVIAAVIGMWRLRSWGWALMVSLVGLSLLLDLMGWWRTGANTSLPSYLRLFLDVVCAFYLNTAAVQDAFRSPPRPVVAPTAGTQSAGRIEP